jgi:cytochrome P450
MSTVPAITTAHPTTWTVPGPRPDRVFGRTGNIVRMFADPIGYCDRLFREHGRIAALTAGGGTNVYSPLPACAGTVFAFGPDVVHDVTSQHDVFAKHPLTGTFYRRATAGGRTAALRHYTVGLFGVNGDEHRRHRRLLMPAFHRKRVESYRDTMIALTDEALGALRPGESVDMADVMRVLTLRIATTTLFGQDVGPQGERLGHMLQDSLRLLTAPLTQLLPLEAPGLPYRRFLDLASRFDDEMRALIARKYAAGATSNDVLSMMIQARDEESGTALTDDELIGHTGVIFAAGHETSANALTWTLLLLSQHPHVMNDLLDELAGELHGDAPTIEQLPRLPLLEAVVKESLRVLSPVPFNGRVTASATALAGHELPPNTEVMVSLYHTHRMPDLYAEPDRFDPRRWESISPTIFEYNPFSAGPRMCIGATFAMMEIRLVLALLLQRFRFQLERHARIDRAGLITLGPRRGLPGVVHRQDRRCGAGVGGVRGNVREMVRLPD